MRLGAGGVELMYEPVRFCWSKEELRDSAMAFVEAMHAETGDSQSVLLQRIGLLMQFTEHLLRSHPGYESMDS